jgi:hypothetical protein
MAHDRLGFDRLESRRVLAADGHDMPGDGDHAHADVGRSAGAADDWGVAYLQLPGRVVGQFPWESHDHSSIPVRETRSSKEWESHGIVTRYEVTFDDGCVATWCICLPVMRPQPFPVQPVASDQPPPDRDDGQSGAAPPEEEPAAALCDPPITSWTHADADVAGLAAGAALFPTAGDSDREDELPGDQQDHSVETMAQTDETEGVSDPESDDVNAADGLEPAADAVEEEQPVVQGEDSAPFDWEGVVPWSEDTERL